MKKIIVYLFISAFFLIGQQPFGKITLPLGMVEVTKNNNKWEKAKPKTVCIRRKYHSYKG